jgi:hypothetical protein
MQDLQVFQQQRTVERRQGDLPRGGVAQAPRERRDAVRDHDARGGLRKRFLEVVARLAVGSAVGGLHQDPAVRVQGRPALRSSEEPVAQRHLAGAGELGIPRVDDSERPAGPEHVGKIVVRQRMREAQEGGERQAIPAEAGDGPRGKVARLAATLQEVHVLAPRRVEQPECVAQEGRHRDRGRGSRVEKSGH